MRVGSHGSGVVAVLAASLLLSVLIGARAQDSKSRQGMPSFLGAWTGTYVCTQGLTGLTLSINGQENETFSGYFHFYPPVTNPQAREGCYAVRGRINDQGQVTVEATRWITQPEGYVTVDLAGSLDLNGTGFTGKVVAPPLLGLHCTTFALKAQVPAPKISPICHAGVASAPSVATDR